MVGRPSAFQSAPGGASLDRNFRGNSAGRTYWGRAPPPFRTQRRDPPPHVTRMNFLPLPKEARAWKITLRGSNSTQVGSAEIFSNSVRTGFSGFIARICGRMGHVRIRSEERRVGK